MGSYPKIEEKEIGSCLILAKTVIVILQLF